MIDRFMRSVVSASTVLVVTIGLVSTSYGNLCFSTETNPGVTITGAIDRDFPTVGVRRNLDGHGYSLFFAGETVEAPTIADLEAAIARASVHPTPRGSPLEIYFENINPNEASNLIGNLKDKHSDLKVEAFAGGAGGGEPPDNVGPKTAAGPKGPDENPKKFRIAPGASQGDGSGAAGARPGASTNGAGKGGAPPGVGNAQVAGGGAVPPSGSGNNPPSGSSIPRPPQAAMFAPLKKRYDWTKAKIEDFPASSPPITMFGFEPGYTFRVVIPEVPEEPRFRISVFFRKLWPRPASEEVKGTIDAALHDDELNRATVQRAARHVIDSINSRYHDNARATVNYLDLIIVLVKPEPRG